MGALFGGSTQPRPVAPPPVQKPLSPVTNRATTEGIIRRRRRSLSTVDRRSLLNEEVEPLGTTT